MDGLADFADGLMANGNKESKHKAMLDPAVGSAGVAASCSLYYRHDYCNIHFSIWVKTVNWYYYC